MEEKLMSGRRWWRRTVAGVCVTGLAMGLVLAGATDASASVDANQSSVNEPDFNPTINGRNATQVLGIGYPGTNPGTNLVLDVYGGSTANGATIELHPSGFETGTTDVAQSNQVWEFVPDPSNTGGTINTGWGSLRDRHSGRCLDITGGYGAGDATNLELWDCHGGENQEWMAVDGGTQIESRMKSDTGDNLYVGVNPTGGCSNYTGASGSVLKARTFHGNQCTTWTITKQSYRFATNAVTVAGGAFASSDDALYRCLNGWAFKNTGGANATPWFDDSISDIHETSLSTVAGAFKHLDTQSISWWVTDYDPTHAVRISYTHNDAPYYQTGQVYLFCVPQ
jgi:hypothetical protein